MPNPRSGSAVAAPAVPVAVALTAALLAGPTAARAQSNWSLHKVDASPAAEPPSLDGVLDEAAWRAAGLAAAFVQQEPDEGAPASEGTEVRVLYDAETLYLGVTAYDGSGDALTATEMRRDSERILEEDNVQIVLDTFKDARSAYMFATNPLGAKLDQQVFNEGEGARIGMATSNINRDWDGVWHVAARVGADGWVAEIAIPLVTLRFPDADTQSWGFNVMRNVGRKNEQSFWAPVPKAYGISRVSLAGSLDGMTGLNRGLDLRITPFATGGGSRVLEGGATRSSFEPDAGLDLKYGITPGLNLDVTVNTDFAQAEVDDEQVNLTRFPLFYPEKRDFFLENSGQFNVGSVTPFNRLVDLFFSRRIGITAAGESVPILGGARLTGKAGRHDIAVMDVQTGRAHGRSGENFLVARYGRNFLSRSRIGGLFVNRAETDGARFNRTYAVDMTLAPHPAFTVVGFLAKTETPGLEGDDAGSYLNATWLDDRWRVYGEYAGFGDDFNPETGFLPRRGIRTTKLHLERNPRPGRWGLRVLSPMVNFTHTTDRSGRLLSRRWHYMVGTRFDNGAYFNIWYNDHFERLDVPFVLGGVEIGAGDYDFGEWRFSFDSNPARRVYYGVVYSPQTFFGGTRTDASASVGGRLTSQLAAEARWSRNWVSLPAGDFDVDLASLRIDFAISPAVSFRSVAQYNSATEQFGASARFRWTYRAGSDVYLAYDQLRRESGAPGEYRRRQLIAKATFLVSR